ncbi:hypothetical protein ASC90_18640 [Rhizobium sp. Root1220]|nr:hypothetical protein ASC90_18640 [Rhizobium sp. Root1220]
MREQKIGLKGTEKLDRTTQAAHDLIKAHHKARDAKTTRLRELRLAREAEEAKSVPTTKRRVPKKNEKQ